MKVHKSTLVLLTVMEMVFLIPTALIQGMAIGECYKAPRAANPHGQMAHVLVNHDYHYRK